MSLVNSLLKPRALLPICVAMALAGHPFPTTCQWWFDELGMTSALADDDDDDDDDGRDNGCDDDRYDDPFCDDYDGDDHRDNDDYDDDGDDD